MTIAIAVLTLLCLAVMARWLLAARPDEVEHVQRLPDGSVPDLDVATRPAMVAASAPAAAQEARKGTGTDAADLVKSGASVSPQAPRDDAAAADDEADAVDTAPDDDGAVEEEAAPGDDTPEDEESEDAAEPAADDEAPGDEEVDEEE